MDRIARSIKSARWQWKDQAALPLLSPYNMSIAQQLTVFALGNPLLLLAALPVILVVAKVVDYLADSSGLRPYPGPFLAKFTDAWIFWTVSRNRWSRSVEDAHKRYGTLSLVASDAMSGLNISYS